MTIFYEQKRGTEDRASNNELCGFQLNTIHAFIEFCITFISISGDYLMQEKYYLIYINKNFYCDNTITLECLNHAR